MSNGLCFILDITSIPLSLYGPETEAYTHTSIHYITYILHRDWSLFTAKHLRTSLHHDRESLFSFFYLSSLLFYSLVSFYSLLSGPKLFPFSPQPSNNPITTPKKQHSTTQSFTLPPSFI
ncbi:hypothetical protein ACMFMF_009236 [Clarireedia jacksonii]